MIVEVIDPGPLTTIQDLGRFGWAHLGVPRAGALDRAAARLANRLVGNAPEHAVLETTMGGVTLLARRAVTFAVTGAQAEVRVDGRPVHSGLPVTVRAGARIHVGPARSGVRSYVAFAGGLAVEPVLGSRSTDTLAWIGPPPLACGQLLPLGPRGHPPAAGDVSVPRSHDHVMTWRRGPRHDWVDDGAWRALDGAEYAVGQHSDRIGLRLVGHAVPRAVSGELASEGVVTGGVQLPPSGHPVVFLADHPTTGGYPVIALVDDADLDWCGQLRPGDRVTIRVR